MKERIAGGVRGCFSGPRAFWIVVVGIVAAVAIWCAWGSTYDHDEGEHLHAAWMVAQGRVPYRDFVEQHHPAYWSLMAPLVRAIDSSHALIFTARLTNLALLGLLLGMLARIIRLLAPNIPARWVLLLLASSFMFVSNSMEARPDPLMNFLSFAAILQWVAFLEDGRRWRAIVAGLLVGAAFVILQKAAVVAALIAFSAILLVVVHRRDGKRVKAIALGGALAVAAASIPAALLLWWVAAKGIWSDFSLWNYAFNRFFYLQADVAIHFSALKTFRSAFAQDPALWLAGGAGFLFVIRALFQERGRFSARADGWFTLAVVAIGYGAFLARNRFPFAQYFIVLFPLVALFAARAFEEAAGGRWLVLLKVAALLMVVEFAAVTAFFPRNADQRHVQEFVLANTSPDQTIFVPPPMHPIFRHDAAYFWINASVLGETYGRFCDVRGISCDKLLLESSRWEEAPPSYVYLDPEDASVHPYAWPDHEANYVPTAIPGLLVRHAEFCRQLSSLFARRRATNPRRCR